MKKRNRKFYDKFYEERIKRESQLYDPNYQKNHTSIIKMLNAISGRVLDIGCGDGIFLDKLRMKFGNSAKYYGIDVSDTAIKAARKKGFHNTYVMDISEEDLPFSDNLFSYIFMVDVIEHIRDPEKVLKECYRVLDTDGTLIISTPNFSFIKRRISYLLGISLYKYNWYEHVKFFNYYDLTKLLEKLNFKPYMWNCYLSILPFLIYKKFKIKNWININIWKNLLAETLVVAARKEVW